MATDLPYNFTPRWYQTPLWGHMQKGGSFKRKRACVVWHRRAGKDLNCIHLICTAQTERIGLYWHIFPTYAQGKKIAWDGMTKEGTPFRNAFPPNLIQGENNTDMKLTLTTGSIYQVVGADNPDSLVGANPIGVVFSEWSLISPKVWEYLMPILEENEGWAIFIFTPRGRNHAFKMLKEKRKDPNWFTQVLKNSVTRVVDDAGIERMKSDGMSEAMIAQEMEVSFDAPVEGSYYGKFLTILEKEGRRVNVKYEPLLPVHTAWDLGIGDYMSIWFYQLYGMEIRIIDFYQNSGEGLAHYVKELQRKPYVYGTHNAPHDINVRELGTGVTRKETANNLGIKFRTARQLPIDEGIEAVRAILPMCWFDANLTENGYEALKHYHKEWDDDKRTFRDKPEHDWSSHAADAFRTLAVTLRGVRKKKGDKQEKQETEYDVFSYV